MLGMLQQLILIFYCDGGANHITFDKQIVKTKYNIALLSNDLIDHLSLN